MNPLVTQIKHQFKSGSMTIKLLIVNIAVFFIIQLIDAFERLQSSTPQVLDSQLAENPRLIEFLFSLPINFTDLALQPWTLLLSLFAHFGLLHLLGNMLFLYFAGSTYERFFGSLRLFQLYLLGGFAGNFIELIAHQVFPALQSGPYSIVGASGAIMAIFIALAVAQPQLQVQLFGIIPLRIYMLAIFFFLKDLTSVGTSDQIAHFAHIGGALFGFWSVQQFWHIRLSRPWLGIHLSRNKQQFKVKKGGRPLTDDQFRANKQERQKKLDTILDKISKKGYDALSKEEKDFLFQQSKDV